MMRTHYCGDLRLSHVGQTVTVCGWAQRARDLGGLVFIDMRDRAGIVQCVFGDKNPLRAAAAAVRSEWCLSITGEVRERSSKNKNIPTGEIEIDVTDMTVFSRAQTPPFEISDDTSAAELLRLEYRYLDLRRPSLGRIMELRHRAMQAIRRFYDSEGFYEIETPILTASTPEGSRDYLVPSRLHPGCFYALPQSPQQYKQLLMVAGMDKYFQIARCMRDEDLRADRQPDFTQIDMEMSFVDREDILDVNERMIAAVFKEVIGADIPTPLPRITYRESLERFGTDKPDTRFGYELKNVAEQTRGCGFSVFESAASVRGINVKGGAGRFTRKEIDSLTEFVKGLGVRGLAWHKSESSSFSKFMSPEKLAEIERALDFSEGDLLLFIADGKDPLVKSSLGALRVECARRMGVIDNSKLNFLWVLEFPLFEYSEEEGRFVAQHHPFCSPMDEDIPLLDGEDLSLARAKAYDLVCNGYELCSGSIRIHDSEVQAKMFRLLGLSEEQMRRRFGHLLKAFTYGVPPHGGVGLGLDRIIMLMAGTNNIRDVIAFPKTKEAVEPMMGCPSPVDQKQLDELCLSITDGK